MPSGAVAAVFATTHGNLFVTAGKVRRVLLAPRRRFCAPTARGGGVMVPVYLPHYDGVYFLGIACLPCPKCRGPFVIKTRARWACRASESAGGAIDATQTDSESTDTI